METTSISSSEEEEPKKIEKLDHSNLFWNALEGSNNRESILSCADIVWDVEICKTGLPITLEIRANAAEPFLLEVLEGQQPIKWLAAQVKWWYQKFMKNTIQWEVQNVETLKKITILPHLKINDTLTNGSTVIVSLRADTEPFDLQKSTYLYYLENEGNLKQTEITISPDNVPDLVPGDVLLVSGNFNSWSKSNMKFDEKANMWYKRVWFLPGKDLEFRFNTRSSHFVSTEYTRKKAADGDLVNLRTLPDDWKDCLSKRLKLRALLEKTFRQVGNADKFRRRTTWLMSQRAPEKLPEEPKEPLPRLPRNGDKDWNMFKIFRKHWDEIQLIDVIPEADDQRALFHHFYSKFKLTVRIYKFFCAFGGRPDLMTKRAFLNCLKHTAIIDELCRYTNDHVLFTIESASGIFDRVDIEEDYVEDEWKKSRRGKRKSAFRGLMTLTGKSSDKALCKSEFIEALIRVALKKYKGSDDPFKKVNRLYEYHFDPEKLSELVGLDIDMDSEKIRAAFRGKLKRIKKIFKIWAKSDNLRDDNRDQMNYQEWNRLVTYICHTQELHPEYTPSRRGRHLAFYTSQTIVDEYDDINNLKWEEFLEALVRISQYFFQDVSSESEAVDIMSAHFKETDRLKLLVSWLTDSKMLEH